jgi:hypothetical protein
LADAPLIAALEGVVKSMKKQMGMAMGACWALSIGLSILASGAQERIAKTDGQEKKGFWCKNPLVIQDIVASNYLNHCKLRSKFYLRQNPGSSAMDAYCRRLTK